MISGSGAGARIGGMPCSSGSRGGKAIRMRQRNDSEIRPVRAQAHGRDDVLCVGHELLRRESNDRAAPPVAEVNLRWAMGGAEPSRSRLAGMFTPPCPVSSGQTTLFSRRSDQPNEFMRMPLWTDRAGRANFLFFAGDEQFHKRPAPAGGKIAQGKLIPSFHRNFPPPFVKHCQFGNPPLTSDASELMILAKTNLGETGARRFEFTRDSFAFANELVWEYLVFRRDWGQEDFLGRVIQTRLCPSMFCPRARGAAVFLSRKICRRPASVER